MKKVFKTIFITLVFILLPVLARAAYLPLTTSVVGTELKAEVSSITDSQSEFQLVGTPSIFTNQNLKVRASGGKLSWVIPNMASGTYLLHVIKGSEVVSATSIARVGVSGTSLPQFYDWPLTYGPDLKMTTIMGQTVTVPAPNTVVVSGKIDIKKWPDVENLKIRFERADDVQTFADSPTSPVSPLQEATISPDGKYSAKFSSLTPKQNYFLRQVIYQAGGAGSILDSKVDNTAFNTSGQTLAGSPKAQRDLDSRSYRLLAPWPGLSILLDPSLCAEQKAAGTLAPNAICSINDLLNYLFKLLIGLSAVGLVLRLIYEGYQYIVTDVPFLKASAKSGFFGALAGLLLALTAWMLLNTINPKLVANDITLDNITVGVEEMEGPIKDFSPQELSDNRCPTPPTTSGYLDDPKIINKICTYNNGNKKFKGVAGIVIHGTGGGGGADSVIAQWVKLKKAGGDAKSAQFIINKDGTIVQATGLDSTANHCGECTGQGKANTSSVGIEVVMVCRGDSCKKRVVAGWEEPTEAQKVSTAYLINLLIKKYGLDKNKNITTHGKEASNRTLNEGENTLSAIKPLLN